MKYVHKEPYNGSETLVIRWCNEINDSTDPAYKIPTFQVREINKNRYYDTVVDLTNELREASGLAPVEYEPTDNHIEPLEKDE